MSTDSTKLLLRFDRQKIYFTIPQGTTVIGRLPRCGIVLGEHGKRVSRDHAELLRNDEGLLVRDLDSRNGTLVNGRDIRGQGLIEVKIGDRLQICEYEGVVTNARSPFNDSGICHVDDDDPTDASTKNLQLDGTYSPQVQSANRTPDRLNALVTIGRCLGGALQSEQMIEKAVQTILDIFPAADRCVLGLSSPDSLFVPKWWVLRHENQDGEIRVSQRIFRHVVDTSDSVLLKDASSIFAGAGSIISGQLRSVMCSPLIDTDNQVIGMIQADCRISDQFSQADLEIFATVAAQISLALNFSKLHQNAIEDAVIRKDIEQARAVQLQFLPKEPPSLPGYQFAHYYSAARHVGGDYYDYIKLSDGRLAIVLGDVVGKGVPAALTMVKLATETRAAFEITCDPAEAMTRLNRRLADSFITCVILVLDPLNHTLQISTAGHETPLLRKHGGSLIRIGEQTSGLPLSVFAEATYESETIPLASGDTLLVYSDGIADAEASDGVAQFGKERIVKTLEAHSGPAQRIARDLIEQIDNFTSGWPQFDDMCLVCFQRIDSTP